jgi:aldose 1-epimerase
LIYPRDDTWVSTAPPIPTTPSPWDDCFTGARRSPRATVNGVNLQIDSDCDHWVVYDMPEHATCIEPQSGPNDAFNIGGFDVARGGSLVQRSMRISWS